MKLNLLMMCLLAIVVFASCDKNDSSQEEDFQNLKHQYTELVVISESIACEDSDDWTYTAIGDKACGGPASYLAYPANINTSNFLNKVEEHRQAEEDYNKRWGIISNCMLEAEPSGVSCEDGKAVLVY